MTHDWFVIHGGRESGPFTAQQLKQMAASGKLQPDDKVRRSDMKAATKASAIKGLFAPVDPTPTKSSPPPATATAPPPPAQKKGGPSKKTLIIASVVGGACLFLCCGGFAIIGMKMTDTARKDLAEADGLWDKGDKAGAVGKYRNLLGSRSGFLKEDDRARVYGRVIDADMESGNTDSAKKLLAEAIERKVEPTVSHPDAKTALAAVRREQQAKAEAQQFTWKQPDGWWGDALKSSDLRFRPMPSADYAELVAALNSKKPERVAKLLQHLDPHTLFTPEELKAMATPYYGYHNFSRNVVRPGEEDGYTEVVQSLTDPSSKRQKFQKAVFVVSGKPDDAVPDFGGGIVSGTCYRGFELKEEKRTKFLAKTVAVHLDFDKDSNFKIKGIKGARLAWITVKIPAIFVEEKCYGWEAMISTFNDRVAYVRFIEKRENALDKMEMERLMPGGGKLAASDSDLYRINYDTADPARPYTIQDLILGTTTKGR